MHNPNPISNKKPFLRFFMICFILLLPFFLYPLYHNWNLRRVSQSFSTIAHPPNTTHVASVNYVGGNVSGTGNQIDYFVAEERSYSGNKKAIRSFYDKLKMWNPLTAKQEQVNLVFPDENNVETSVFLQLKDINKWQIFESKKRKSYAIYFHDGGYTSGFDGRGY